MSSFIGVVWVFIYVWRIGRDNLVLFYVVFLLYLEYSFVVILEGLKILGCLIGYSKSYVNIRDRVGSD